MTEKRQWQEPVVRTIDQLQTAYGGICDVGNTVTSTSPNQCSSGGGPQQGGCRSGSGASGSTVCSSGNGVQK